MIIPSLDILNGEAVQLRQGTDVVLREKDVFTRAAEFSAFGVLGIVDLNGAFTTGNNDMIIKRLCALYECRVGGGIRTVERAKQIVAWGANRIIIGSAAFSDNGVAADFLNALVATVGKERIAVAMDYSNKGILKDGWRKSMPIEPLSFIRQIEPYASELFVTAVDREGLEQGSDEEFFKKIRSQTEMAITVAGGFSDADAIERMTSIGVNVQLGMALYTKSLSLGDAFTASVRFKNYPVGQLVSVIAVDESGQVLMTAYMNREALRRTLAERQMWYYSRSREQLWKKGVTSGNAQTMLSVRSDCDGDALLFTVRQKGHACHASTYSCFGDKRYSIDELYGVIAQRFSEPIAQSYTSGLTDAMIREKITEEAQELIEAVSYDELVWEAADVLFFTLALCAKNGVSFTDVLAELRRRRRS